MIRAPDACGRIVFDSLHGARSWKDALSGIERVTTRIEIVHGTAAIESSFMRGEMLGEPE
jgi:hypothetical protein